MKKVKLIILKIETWYKEKKYFRALATGDSLKINKASFSLIKLFWKEYKIRKSE